MVYQSPAQRSAKEYVDLAVDRLTQDEDLASVKSRIIELWTTSRMTVSEISLEVLGDHEIAARISKTTRDKIVRALCAEVLPPEVRREAASLRHQETVAIHGKKIQSAQKKYLRANGMYVWRPSEVEFFKTLIGNPEYARIKFRLKRHQPLPEKPRLDHEKIAKAMNRHFHTSRFTQKLCADKYERMNAKPRSKRNGVHEKNEPSNGSDGMNGIGLMFHEAHLPTAIEDVGTSA